MCLKVIENGKHKDVHIKEGEVSAHIVVHAVVSQFRQFTSHFWISWDRGKSGELDGNKTVISYIKLYDSIILWIPAVSRVLCCFRVSPVFPWSSWERINIHKIVLDTLQSGLFKHMKPSFV